MMKRKFRIALLFVTYLFCVFVGWRFYSIYYNEKVMGNETYHLCYPIYRCMKSHDIKGYIEYADSIRKDTPKSNEDYLYYALYAAHALNYIPANYDVYNIITGVFKKYDIEIDETSKKIAYYYLERGAILGDEKCLEIIRKHQ